MYQNVNSTVQKTLFTTSTYPGLKWTLAKVDVTSIKQFNLMFEGKKTRNGGGAFTVSLDDVSVASGTCASQTTTVSPPPTPFSTASELNNNKTCIYTVLSKSSVTK